MTKTNTNQTMLNGAIKNLEKLAKSKLALHSWLRRGCNVHINCFLNTLYRLNVVSRQELINIHSGLNQYINEIDKWG